VSWLYRHTIRPCLFLQDSERIHNRTLRALGRISRSPWLTAITRGIFGSPLLPLDVMGLHFPNPVGLAAGMDKVGEAVPVWQAFGFGFSELGGITRHAQPGNDAPRMFRVIPDEALINRMGFNNPGADAFATALKRWRDLGRWPSHPVGVNLGKSKITPLGEAATDYAYSFRILRPLADFFVVNVSSPNTPNLRQLQDRTALDEILSALNEVQNTNNDATPRRPILVKVAPDLTFDALDEIVELAESREDSRASWPRTPRSARPDHPNPARHAISTPRRADLSGRPLDAAKHRDHWPPLPPNPGAVFPIIGVGGIFTAEDAWEKITGRRLPGPESTAAWSIRGRASRARSWKACDVDWSSRRVYSSLAAAVGSGPPPDR
jgi:dihydroorotate dehydrogenase